MNDFVIKRRFKLTGPLFAAVILLGGCGSLPDLKGFAEATGDIQTGIATVGSEFSESIPATVSCGRDKNEKPINCKARFESEWRHRVDAIAAIADYSDSLAQIVDAGNAGAESAERVMKSATGLLDVLKVAPLSSVITDAATKALAALAKYRALRSLDDAIDKAHGPISDVAGLLEKDLDDLGRTIDSTLFGITALIEAKDIEQAGSHMRFAQVAIKEHRALMVRDHQGLTALSIALAEIRSGKPATNKSCNNEDDCGQKLRALDKRIAETRARLISLERDLQGLEKSYAPIRIEREVATVRAGKTLKAVGQLKIGLKQWIAVHKSLGESVRKSLRPNARQLIATAKDLKKIIDDLRKEK